MFLFLFLFLIICNFFLTKTNSLDFIGSEEESIWVEFFDLSPYETTLAVTIVRVRYHDKGLMYDIPIELRQPLL